VAMPPGSSPGKTYPEASEIPRPIESTLSLCEVSHGHMWIQDFRYALRLLRRSPGFAATAILTLAVSIGANAAIWSAVKGILVAPLPYPDPYRLVRLFEEASTTPHFPFAPADFRDYRAELRTFDGIAAYGRSD